MNPLIGKNRLAIFAAAEAANPGFHVIDAGCPLPLFNDNTTIVGVGRAGFRRSCVRAVRVDVKTHVARPEPITSFLNLNTIEDRR
jgi:hypothetical protein